MTNSQPDRLDNIEALAERNLERAQRLANEARASMTPENLGISDQEHSARLARHDATIKRLDAMIEFLNREGRNDSEPGQSD